MLEIINRRRVLAAGAALTGVAVASSMGPAPARGAGTAPAPAPAAAGDRPPARPWRIQVVLYDGVVGIEFINPFEVFSVAGMLGGAGTQVSFVRVDGPGTIHIGGRTPFVVDNGWAPEQADLIVVPGSGPAPDGPGVPAEIARGVLPRALAAARRRGLTIASVCTGALLLGAAGLVHGRPCTTHHSALAQLAEQGGVIKNARVVDDGDLVTAGGVTSGLDLALWLVKREFGAEVALAVETIAEYQARGTVWTG